MPIEEPIRHRILQTHLILRSGFAIFVLVGLFSYSVKDPAWSNFGQETFVRNQGGQLGAWISDVLFFFLGYLAYVPPLLILGQAMKRRRVIQSTSVRCFQMFGCILLFLSATALASLYMNATATLMAGPGGMLGQSVGWGLLKMTSMMGATILLVTMFLLGFSWVFGHGVEDILLYLYRRLQQTMKGRGHPMPKWSFQWPKFAWSMPIFRKKEQKKVTKNITVRRMDRVPELKKQDRNIEPIVMKSSDMQESYVKPNPNLLIKNLERDQAGEAKKVIETCSLQLESALAAFGIKVKVVEAHSGPVITRYEVALAEGVRSKQIANLSEDIARSLSVSKVRVVEVIPGKTVIGIEIPNKKRALVRLHDIIDSPIYSKGKAPLNLALGQDISGQPVWADLAKMPHLLVAGTTGSGKSVGINAMVLSLLYNATPDELRLILIDPKMLELSVYEGIGHLLTPVVTDMKEAASALRWCVAEMERRYKLMAAMGVRNIAGYNDKVKVAKRHGKPLKDPLHPESDVLLDTLPLIVVVADEFADMIMVVGKEVEQLIARIAQKARAAGIHLILATQRPSVDVITGLIKANVPTRIAFQVSSKIDSRTVLDQGGAEQLLGHGDMLYLPPGTGMPIRVHGAFVEDSEVHKVVNFLKKQTKKTEFVDILKTAAVEGNAGINGGQQEQDPLYEEAVKLVIESKRASISSVQRRLRIGYNRAANLIEAMEENGVVSPMESSGARKVLVDE